MNKRIYFLVIAFGILSCTPLAGAQGTGQGVEKELRPAQKLMQARAGWVKAMNSNLNAIKYEEVSKDALALAAQTSSVAEKQPDGLAKELTMRLSTLASATAKAAGEKKSEAIKTKLADIQATCAECHAKIRDKK